MKRREERRKKEKEGRKGSREENKKSYLFVFPSRQQRLYFIVYTIIQNTKIQKLKKGDYFKIS